MSTFFFFFGLSDLFSFFKIILFIYLFLAVLGLHCAWGFSLVAASKGYSLVAVCWVLIALVSHAEEHGF